VTAATKQAQGRHATSPGVRHTWPAFLLLAIGLVLTFAAGKLARDQVDTKLSAVFEAQNASILNRLRSAIDEQQSILHNMLGLYDGHVQVVRDVFELFAAVPARSHESIRFIAWAPRITAAERPIWLDYVRNQGLEYLNYSITPSGDRPESFPVEYLVPLGEFRNLLGFDVLTDEVKRHAVTEARQKGSIVATSMFKLHNGREAFSFIAPVFRNGVPPADEGLRLQACTGVLILDVLAAEFIRKAVEREADSSLIAIAVYDGLAPDARHLLYSEVAPRDPVIEQHIPLNFANHTWTIVTRAKPALRGVANTWLPTAVMIGGGVTTVLLFLFVFSLVTSRARAEIIAERITRSQRRIVDSSPDLIGAMDISGVWLSMNPASERILGYAPGAVIGRRQIEFIVGADRPRFQKAIEDAENETPLTITVRMIATNGGHRWIDWSITVSHADALIYCIGRDSTEQIAAEQEIVRKNVQLGLAAMITDRENIRKERTIRDQNIRFRMQLTSVMGFLQLILQDRQIDKQEMLDYVETADVAAEELFRELRDMTEVDLKKMEDVGFNIADHASHEIVSRLLQGIDEFEQREGLTLKKDIGVIPEHRINVDLAKLLDANELILGLLRPHIATSSSIVIQCERKSREGWFVVDLRFDGLVNLPDTSCWIPSMSRNDIVRLEQEEDFSLALLHPVFEVMDAGFELSNTAANDGCVLNYRFVL
jgi:PAS domain S-box-containing protein